MKIFFVILGASLAIKIDLFAAEAGMPQLDPKYWASQAFWLILVFTLLYLTISKIFIPKIKDNLDDRENKIKNDIDEASNLKDLSEKKQKEYNLLIENAKKEVQKILNENKNKLNIEIQNKKKIIQKEIEEEIQKAQMEIKNLKKDSIDNIAKISEEIAEKIIEEISGDKLNKSSIKAAISEASKKNMDKYL
jgi:F-type H+-transporting ATPase subunit b